ncbi:uncharacterized protein [Apostichopus japonicus]|uniref:uncharacterized protein n=1 Tax=Stichopus japonicus TaxID=307972 RepID=UPI003AB5A9C7
MDTLWCLILLQVVSASYASLDGDVNPVLKGGSLNVMDILKQKSLGHDLIEENEIVILKSAVLELQNTVEDLQGRLGTAEKFLWAEKGNGRRTRRSSGQDLPTSGCTPGAVGCPGAYTPYFMGQCFLCPPGPAGAQGPPGSEGERGRDGRDGRDGDRGPKGDNGDCESASVASNNQQSFTGSAPTSNNTGVIYVRWGRSECPVTSELLYSGVAGGAHYSNKGGASNYLCLPQEPIYDEPEATAHSDRGYLYGSEYQTNTYPPYAHLHDSEVPCAVCKAAQRSSYIMVPARNACPGSEWTLEYFGHLMSDYHNHWKTEFVCMDRNAEAIPRTVANANGALFYPVEGRCSSSGGIPCGPYVNGYELTCAVCTL